MEPNMRGWRGLWEIFWSFFKIGPVTFGGGYAMIPFFEQEIVNKRKWVRQDEVADVFALAGTIPGAIAVNSAALIGYRLSGIRGALAALAGVTLPTFFIVLVLSVGFFMYRDHPKVAAAFEGIRPAIVALIVYAGIKIGKTSVYDKSTFGIAASTIAVLLLFHSFIHPVALIVIGGVAGIAVIKVKQKLGMITQLDQKPSETGPYQDYFFGEGI